MIQIENTIVSFDIFEKKFACDYAICKGICCIEGDSGAPLKESEKEEIARNYEGFKPYMKEEGIKAIEKQGFTVVDSDGDLVTPLINGVECAYSINEEGGCWCAIEKAWTKGESSYRKPISCHLYPIRVTYYEDFDALNYHKWDVCKCARQRGYKENIPVYRFLKDALITAYGEEWYAQLEYVAKEMEAGRLITV